MRPLLPCTVVLLTLNVSGGLHADEVETVLITGIRADRVSKGATGLKLDVSETPQSISFVTSEQMENFGASELNDALRLATGINVEEWETNRTNYLSRGFEIKNTQVDGVGLPNNWGIVIGDMDAFGYDKLEVIRGANGLLTGVGNASGTINYVRKRPTNHARASFAVTGGSWDRRRVEADYSTPFTDSGSWAGRVVVAAEEEDSYLRGLSNERAFVYGVIDGQISEHSTVAAGVSWQDANTDGNMWGGLVLANNDGTQAEFPRSASTTQDWAYWDATNRTAFIEYTYALPQQWNLKLTYNYRDFTDESQLYFVYPTDGLDPITGAGLSGWPGRYPTDDDASLIDLTMDGAFSLFGREHEAIVGLNYSTGERTLFVHHTPPDAPAWQAPPFPYAGNAVPEPEWGPREIYSTTNQRMKRAYGATHFNVTDKLNTIVGFNWTEYHRDGQNLGESFDQTERELSPYAGITYQLSDNLLAYASYSDIYQPQEYYDINERFLNPSKGVNYELGLKAEWIDRRLLTTLAWFSAEQKNLGTFAGLNEANGRSYYEGVDIESDGIEFEITGQLSETVAVVLGFTKLDLSGEDGADIYEWVPREMVNLALTARAPLPFDLTLGVTGRWQSDIAKEDAYTGMMIRQDSYATVDLFARWDITDRMYVRANAYNVSDEKYIVSLYEVGYYSAPRNYTVSFGYDF